VIPVLWLLTAILAARWLGADERTAEQQVDGNPLERNLFMGLLACGLVVLSTRGQRVSAVLKANLPIVLFFVYCLLSTAWSDFPAIAFKRWIKALGDLVMVLIVLTEVEWPTAVARFLSWVGFILLPVSVLLIKYFQGLGVIYKFEEGRQVFVGVTNDKNLLGVICVIFGLVALWRVVHALRATPLRKGHLFAHGAILSMAFWLLAKAHSMTAIATFSLAACLVLATSFPGLARRRPLIHVLVASLITVAAIALFADFGAGLVQAMGRDQTLTGRTEIWSEVLDLTTNPVLGTGFESFWMGDRLEVIWAKHWWHPNEAHNGYLEVFINLGWMGVLTLGAVVITGYRNAHRTLERHPDVGGLALAFFTLCLAYNFTEAGFRLLNPIWICFLVATADVPEVVPASAEAKDAVERPTAAAIAAAHVASAPAFSGLARGRYGSGSSR